jgi:hypothetical protein
MDTPTVTSLKTDNADGTQFSAEINGKTYSGITEKSRFWASVQKAIDDGAVVEPYVAPVMPSEAEIALQKTDIEMARVTDDLIDTLVSKGVITMDDLPVDAKDKVNNRKALRSQL